MCKPLLKKINRALYLPSHPFYANENETLKPYTNIKKRNYKLNRCKTSQVFSNLNKQKLLHKKWASNDLPVNSPFNA